MVRTLNLKETQRSPPSTGLKKHMVLGFLHLLLWLSRLARLFWAVLRAPAHNHVQWKVTVLKIARVAGSLLSNAGGWGSCGQLVPCSPHCRSVLCPRQALPRAAEGSTSRGHSQSNHGERGHARHMQYTPCKHTHACTHTHCPRRSCQTWLDTANCPKEKDLVVSLNTAQG